MGCGDGREAQEEGDICIIMADLHCCLAETNQHCKNELTNKNVVFILEFGPQTFKEIPPLV